MAQLRAPRETDRDPAHAPTDSPRREPRSSRCDAACVDNCGGAGVTFHDRCDSAGEQHTRLADTRSRNSRYGTRRNGHGQSNVMGVVSWRDPGNRHRVRGAADRQLGPRHVWGLSVTREGGPAVDPLFVGATRPPMRWGVTYSALLLNLVLTLEAFLLTRNLLTLLLCAPVHTLCALLCLRDPRFFDLLMLWARTRLPTLAASHRLWCAGSYGPLAQWPAGSGRRRAFTPSPVLWSSAGGARR